MDGWVLPEAPAKTFASGHQAAVPVLLGSLANEGVELLPMNAGLTDADFDAYLDKRFGRLAQPIKQAYRAEFSQSPALAQGSLSVSLSPRRALIIKLSPPRGIAILGVRAMGPMEAPGAAWSQSTIRFVAYSCHFLCFKCCSALCLLSFAMSCFHGRSACSPRS